MKPRPIVRINRALRKRDLPVSVLSNEMRIALIDAIEQAYSDGVKDGQASEASYHCR